MKKIRTIDLYIISVVFAIIAGCILRTFALLTSFNNVSMHFDDKILITISTVIVVLAVIGFASYLTFGEKETDLIAKSDNAASFIPAGIICTALIFMGIRNLKLSFGSYPAGMLRTLSLLSTLLALISVASFFISILIERKEDHYKAAFSLSIVFFLALYSAILFFNKGVHPTNSPNKLVDQMAYICAAIFFLYESRIPLGRAKWRPYISFGLMAILLTAYSSIPSLIVYVVNGYVVSDSLIESVLSLSIFFFIFSKVLQTRSLTPNEENDAVKSIISMARVREEELENQRKLSKVENITNTIDDTEDASNYTFDIPYVEATSEINTEDASIDLSQSE